MRSSFTQTVRWPPPKSLYFRLNFSKPMAVVMLAQFFVFLLPFLIHFAQTTRIELATSLIASTESSPWRSSNGDFAFGFHRLGEQENAAGAELFLLAIWFDKIPDKTIVWYANGEHLAPKGSQLELTSGGNLTLNDPEGAVIWRAETIDNGRAFPVDKVNYAEMLDTGNFVLVKNGSIGSYEWQSFDHPTDTILPTQVLTANLTSRETRTNYLKGRFQLRMLPDGNLVLNTIGLGSILAYAAYYHSHTFDGNDRENSGQRLEFGQLGNLYVVRNNGNITNLTTINSAQYPTTDFYYRATLEYDGYFRRYVHPKVQRDGSSTNSWIRIWFVPEDICVDITSELGGGSCGFNMYCVSDNGWPTCKCLPGFYESENGCVQEKVHNCDLGGLKPEQVYEIVPLENTFWPTSANSDELQPSNEENCTMSCLNDCNCVVAEIRGGRCWKKKLPLSNGNVDTKVDGKALVKIPKSSNSEKQMDGKPSESNKIPGGWIALGGSVLLNVLLVLGALVFFYISRHKQRKLTTATSTVETNLHCFTFDELKRATDGFKEEVGRGAFGTVYKGFVSSMNSTSAMAVKKLDKVLKEGEKEFKAEVQAIGKTHHKNLVRLIGFCDE